MFFLSKKKKKKQVLYCLLISNFSMCNTDDPEVSHTQLFRNFLKEHVVFKEVNL